MLLGLYQGLFIYFFIKPKTVFTWKREGILIQEIKKVFEDIPPQNQGQYYPWFLEHQDLLDPSLEPSTKATEDFCLELVIRAWRHIGGRPLPNSTSAVNDITSRRRLGPSINEIALNYARSCYQIHTQTRPFVYGYHLAFAQPGTSTTKCN